MPPILDVLLFVLVPLICLVVAIYFATARRSAEPENARSLDGFIVGAALAATFAAGLHVVLPGEAYYVGLKGLLVILLLWLAFPWLGWTFVPGIVGPTIGSPLTYLDKRFGPRLSFPATAIYLLGRALVSAIILASLARMVALALGDIVPPMLIAFAVGLLATGCVAACGKRGGVWMSATLALLMAIALPFAIATVLKATGGADRIWEIGTQFGRTGIADPTVDISSPGVVWNLLPFAWSVLFVFLVGDEASTSRLSLLRSAASVRAAIVTLLLGISLFAVCGMYAGLGTFVYYHEHPREVRPKWVANVEPATRDSLTQPDTQSPLLDPATGEPMVSLLSEGYRLDPTTGVPVLPWDEAEITRHTIEQLVEQGLIYNVNSQRPVASIEELLDETGERIDPTKLASYSLPRDGQPSEMLFHRRATEEIWPYFVTHQASPGMRGLILGALLAAAVATVVDLTGLLGTTSLSKLFPSQSTAAQRVVATLASLGVTLVSMLCTFVVPNLSEAMPIALAASLTPVAGVVLLGLTSRRANSGVALATLAFGVLHALVLGGLVVTDRHHSLHPMWVVTLTLLDTFVMGQLVAMIFGESRRRQKLRGLVLGDVPIGAIEEPEHRIEIDIPDPEEEPTKWR